jgi:hypothetical protein
MNKVLLVSIFSFLIISQSHPTKAADIAQSLCEYIAADDKKRMRAFLKTNRVKIRTVFTGIQCNGKNLLAFAVEKSSIKTGSLMISKLPKSVVSANLAILQSGPTSLLEAANKRVGG